MTIPPVLVYSLTRVALFAATLVILLALLAGRVPFLLVLAIAALVSGVASYFLLARQRQAMAASVAARVHGVAERVDRAAAAEDAQLDQTMHNPVDNPVDADSLPTPDDSGKAAGQAPDGSPSTTQDDWGQPRHGSQNPDGE